jgi:DNA repair protein RecO (recombination protein O)
VTRIESEGLVLRKVEVGESDIVATLVTEQIGKLSVIARGARKGSRRLGGALEPVHTVLVAVDDRGQEIATLKEAQIVRMRPSVVSDLDALEVAGVALRWARHLFPPRTREPEGWRVIIELLDRLDARARLGLDPRKELARAGLAMLAAVGYALELSRCVSCGRPCPSGRSACIDPGRGGLVCRSCGGAASVLAPGVRQAAVALASGHADEITDRSARSVLNLVDRAMAAHTGFER